MNDNQLIFEAYLTENGEEPEVQILPNGDKIWRKDGRRHREDGPAVELADGNRIWMQLGFKHRLDGPAFISPEGYKAWWVNGKRHREDGPAVIHEDGGYDWYLNDRCLRMEDWAEGVLKLHNKPSDPEAVKEFLRSILAKQTKDLI